MRGPYSGLAIFMAMLPFGMMAAVNLPAVGGTSILVTDAAMLTLFAMMLMRQDVGRDLAEIFTPGTMAMTLLGFLCYSILSTLFFPRVFEGATEVFSLSRIANEDGIVSMPLRPTTGNLAQLLRIMLTLGSFLVVAILVRRRPDSGALLHAVKIMTGVHVGLGIIDLLTNAAGLAFLMEPIRTANYSLTLGQELAGLNRMIGGFAEASSFGYYALGLFGFWLSHWLSERDSTGGSSGLWLALSAFALLRCTSSSAYVGAAGFCLVFSVVQLRRGSTSMSVPVAWILTILLAIIPLLIVGSYAAYSMVPSVTEFVDRSLLDKLSSTSGVERMSWNAQAFRNFLDTWLLGAGFGSVRASNWLLASLASVGLPGTVLFLAFYFRLFTADTTRQDAATARLVTAFKMGCLAFAMRSLVVHGSPNLGYGFFVFAGVVQGLTLAARSAVPGSGHAAAGGARQGGR